MIKIEIKHRWTGSILFEYSKENNTVKDTVIEAVKNNADLQGAYLRGADLQGADLQDAYLQGADLQGAYLRGAYLQGADLQGAYLQGADLRGADLQGVKIKKAAVFTGLYKYICIPFISEENEIYIKMGCYTRLLSEWENDFWNNPSEFPNNGNIESKYRVMAYEFCKQWIELNK